MLFTFDEVSKQILSGAVLRVAGSESLLRRLPKGSWIGGSTEYFIADNGGKISSELLYVSSFEPEEYTIATYDKTAISNVAADAYDNGFSVAIIPFESEVHKEYAHNAPDYQGMFIKNIVGWISGVNLNVPGQTPIAVNGQTGEVTADNAVVLHLRIPDGQSVNIGIVNIFEQDTDTPVIEFSQDGFSVKTCLVDGKETVLADYLAENKIDTRLPLIGAYSGAGVNLSFKEVRDGAVSFYAPVFGGIKYRIAKPVGNYTEAFSKKLEVLKDANVVFACNCVLNFLYGELEGKETDMLSGPITFGEIAYQLVNQTLVYVTILG